MLSQRIGAIAASSVHDTSLSPNHLTLASSALILLASVLYVALPAGLASALVILVILQLAYGLDCADGQLARARRETSEFGGWLDITMDAIFGTVLTFSILVWIVGIAPALVLPGAVGLCALTAGRIVAVYSGKIAGLMAARSGASTAGGAPASGEDRSGPLRRLVVLLMDTPVLYLGLCVFRDFPLALSAYAAILGALLGMTSFRIGLRLRSP